MSIYLLPSHIKIRDNEEKIFLKEADPFKTVDNFVKSQIDLSGVGGKFAIVEKGKKLYKY